MEIHPIRTEADYQGALREIEELFDVAANTPEYDRLEILSTLVDAYETKQFPIELPDPIAAIHYYMDARGWSDHDLESCLGGPTNVADVLSRKCDLTLEMIRQLKQQLEIPAEILIQPYKSPQISA
jgi:HTH-type transcriptional regulator/antitoxin HigA